MVAPKKTEILAGFGQKPKQLEKLENEKEREPDRTLGKHKWDYVRHWTDHFQISVDEGRADRKGIENHGAKNSKRLG